jgi:hypothetical protein
MGDLTIQGRPFGFSARPLRKVTFFGTHDATVTGGQLTETGVTVALIKTLFCQALASDTLNHAGKG